MYRRTAPKSWLLATGTAALLLFALAPFAWMVTVALSSRPDLIFAGRADLTLHHFVNVLRDPSLHFLSHLRNSLIVASLTALVVTLIATLAGYAVSRLRFRGRLLIPLAALAVSMFPPISIVGQLYRFFTGLGWLNTHVALILPYCALWLPLALWITMSYFAQIPHDLDRAARIDGASRLTIIRRVLLPIALPGIFSSFLLVAIASFNEFLLALMLTRDARAQTLPVGIAMFEGLHGEIPWGDLMAAATIATIPLVLLAVFFQRYIVQGLMGGAVKG